MAAGGRNWHIGSGFGGLLAGKPGRLAVEAMGGRVRHLSVRLCSSVSRRLPAGKRLSSPTDPEDMQSQMREEINLYAVLSMKILCIMYELSVDMIIFHELATELLTYLDHFSKSIIVMLNLLQVSLLLGQSILSQKLIIPSKQLGGL